MKQKFTITLEVEARRHDFYPDAHRVACRRCVLYTICTAVTNMQDKFPYSFVEISEKPCRQNVQAPDRKYIKFSSR